MLSSVTLAAADGTDVSLHNENGAALLSSVHGLIGIAAPRDQRRVRPTAHGGIDQTRWEDGKLVVLEGECWGTSQEDAYAQFRAITKPMLETLDYGPGLIKWQEGESGNQLQRYVKLASDVDPVIEEAAAVIKYQASFYSEDPRSYGQTLTTTVGETLSEAAGGLLFPFTFPFTFNPSSGGEATLTVEGNRPTPAILRIYGYCSAPRVRLLSTGQEVVLTGEVGSGNFLELDTYRRTISLNGVTSRPGLRDFTATNWFELPTGEQTVQLLATNFDGDARVDVLSRPAFT